MRLRSHASVSVRVVQIGCSTCKTCALSSPLHRLVREGELQRVGRGLYALSSRHVSEHGTLAEVASKYPQSLICLISALQMHQLTTQVPFEVWLGIANVMRPYIESLS